MKNNEVLINKICSLYFDDEDNNAHLTGYIIEKNEDELICKHINQRGEYDGYIWSRISDLYRVCYEGKYERKIACLYHEKGQKHPPFEHEKGTLIKGLLEYAKKNNYLVSADLRTDSFTGWVQRYTNKYIEIKCVNEYGEEDGKEIISIDEIESLSCDTDYEQDVLLIIRMKKHNISGRI